MTPYAQTNVQLYQQLARAQWVDEDLRHVQSAYQLAMRVVAGHYRASEKSFLAHLVGVASILAHHGAHATVVSAGLLHSVYRHGDFGDGTTGISETRRRIVRRSVGAASEELVARYAGFTWSVAVLEQLLASAHRLAPLDGTVAWMKLADLLEGQAELYLPGSLVADPDAAIDRERSFEVAAALANALGYARMAAELSASLPAGAPHLSLFLPGAHREPFAVAPLSHGLRPGVRLARLLHRFRDSLLATAPRVAKEAA